MLVTHQKKIRLIEDMMQNHTQLCTFIFDDSLVIQQEARKKFIEIYDFVYKRSLDFFPNINIRDFVISGSMCSFTYSDLSDLDLFIYVDNIFPSSDETSAKVLTFINSFLNSLSCKPKFHGHVVDYGVLSIFDDRYKNPFQYSIFTNKWKNLPIRNDYPFSANDLYLKYCHYSADLHHFVHNLDKVNNAFLTLESCVMLKNHLRNLRNAAFDAKDNNPYHEYSIEYNLYRLLKKFGTYTHFDNYILESYKNLWAKKHG